MPNNDDDDDDTDWGWKSPWLTAALPRHTRSSNDSCVEWRVKNKQLACRRPRRSLPIIT